MDKFLEAVADFVRDDLMVTVIFVALCAVIIFA